MPGRGAHQPPRDLLDDVHTRIGEDDERAVVTPHLVHALDVTAVHLVGARPSAGFTGFFAVTRFVDGAAPDLPAPRPDVQSGRATADAAGVVGQDSTEVLTQTLARQR